jgi:hypothetical protein
MRQNLVHRLEKLERRFQPAGGVVHYWVSRDPEDRTGLAENERIVHDLYRQEAGMWALARERITTDPTDQGRRCPPGGYLEDVLREVHQECEWRGTGLCGNCHGLEHLFSSEGPAGDGDDSASVSPCPSMPDQENPA